MRLPALARTTHKWLGLIIAIQAVFWTVSGLYMAAVHIDIIHGDRLVRPAPAPAIALAGLVEPGHLAHFAPGLKSARLETQLGRPVYVVDAASGKALFDAKTGQRLSPLDEAGARARAKALFAERGEIVGADLLTNNPPTEIQTRPLPLWRVEFEGAWRPTFYISPFTGELVARRHDLWRTYDFLWMFHIMDYENRSDVNNVLIRIATWMAFAGSLTGAWLLLYSFRRRRRPRKPA
ncbi:MAG: PepSY domain-containing protein [Alphaproteobacteria bacterium]|nr:PepSY domain-containing protein [Alphaproteobacteria bacterium]MBU1514527.1 PepSY domain-containing protein [Alphaproteobacteria bacterium]MBU2096841.1 PepSY domain-containing protein [Alphaproteobacteria bacterium]MBU2153468.1 PepSY domain-containing protein [Alphaproteobacteria bacterium]MBU2306027.1 PepSY domain-containing protein [Alphaproteobacteria bacterium]